MNDSRSDNEPAARTPANPEWLAQATLDALSAHIAVLDDAGTIIAVNRAWHAFAESNPPLWSNVSEGANYLAVCDAARGANAAEAAPVAAAIREVIRGERGAFAMEYPCHSDATQRWFICRVTSCPGPGPRRAVVAHENITARKLAEAELRTSEERLRLVLESVNEGVWDWNMETGRAYLSPRYYEMTGYAPGEVVPDFAFFESLVHPEDRAAVLRNLEHHLQCQREPSILEFRMITKTGGIRHVLSRGCVVQRDDQGVPKRMLGTLADITERRRAEEALSDNEERLRFAMDVIETGEWDLDLVDHTSHRSPIHDRIFGYAAPLPAWTYEIFLAHVVPEDRAAVDALFKEAMANHGNWNFECRIVRCDGERRWILVRGRHLLAAGGQPRRMAGIVQDITDRKEVEQELRSSELEFRAMFETASIGMAQANPHTGRLLRANQKLATITGYTTAELLGLRVQDITHPGDRDKDWALFQQVVRGEVPAYRVEKRYIRKDGSVAWVNVNMTIIRDAAGVPQRTLATIEDITERRVAEEQRARLAMAVEQSAEAIVITDTDGTIVYVNPAFEKISGYSATEAIGRNPRILGSGRHTPEFYRDMWITLTAGQTWSGHIINRSKDGRLFEEAAIISPVLDATGRIVNYVAVKRDITREAQLELQLRQAQKMDAVGRLAGGVAHDFNNLLMGIMGYAEMCQANIEPDHPVREWLDEIMRGAKRSADLTRQLLAFASKQVIAPRILNLNEAVSGMLKMLRRLIGEDIELTFQPGAELWPVLLDPSQVDQILANLCVNARDAIAGVGRITLRTDKVVVDETFRVGQPDAVPGCYVSLTVGDTGCGMDAATLAQIFEPFFTTKAFGKGTGLGLSTVYGIVKQNRGFIGVDCAPGRGSTFTIYLPRAETQTAEPLLPSTEAPRRGGETILLTEDEQGPREICRLFLESLGYRVLTAVSPAEALALAAAHPERINLLITDVVMPGMDGRQLARELGASKPGLKVLFMSGYTPDVVAQRGVTEPNTAFLAKPFTRDELAARVRAVLDGPAV